MTTTSQGFDTFTQAGIDRPFGTGLATATLDQDNTYLAKFAAGFGDGDTLASDTFTIYAAEAWPSGVSLSLKLIAEDWQPSQVVDATLPATTGTAATTGALGALAAGDPVTFTVTSLMQQVADNTVTWRGVAITRLDAGASVAMYAFEGVLPPVQDVTVAQVLPQPTGLSPAGGRAVSGSQVPLRVTNWASGLGEIALAAMRVQWSASTSFASPLADDTQAVSSPEFDMTKTQRVTAADGHTTSGSAVITSASGPFTSNDVGTKITGTNIPGSTTILTYTSPTQVTMSANATGTATTTVFTIGSGFALPALQTMRYWRTQLQSTDGSWSDWSDPVATNWRSLGTVTITFPGAPPGNVSADPDPLLTYTYSPGTEAQHRYTRASIADLNTLLGDTGKVPTLTSGQGYVGYEVLDYGSYTDTVYVYDSFDREDVPGFPSYATAEVTWSLTDDASINPPTIDNVSQLGGTSPFIVVEWSQDHNADYKVFADDGSGEKNVSGTMAGGTVLVSVDEAGRHYLWIWYGAQPGTLYDIRVRAYSDKRGSATSDVASILTDTSGVWLGCPDLDDWLLLLNDDIGEWVRAEPNSAAYGPLEHSAFYKRVRGNRMGYSTRISGDLAPVEGRTVNSYHRSLLNLSETDSKVYLVTPHEVVEVAVGNISSTPGDWPDLRRRAAFDVWQTGPSTLAGSDVTAPQTETTIIDFESYANGAAVTTADPSGLISAVTGTVQGNTAAAMHGSVRGCKMTDVSGGSYIQVNTNALANTIDIYSSGISATPSTDRNLIRWKTASGQACAIRVESTGKIDIRDSLGNRTVYSSSKLIANQAFRLQGKMVWYAGVVHVEARVWIGLNVEGVNPDAILVSDIAAAAAPNGLVNIGSITTSGYDWSVDDIRVSNTSAGAFGALGVPTGSVTSAQASTTSTTMRVAVCGITGVSPIKIAYSTTQGADGFPSSPSFSSAATVDAYGTAQVDITGLTAHTQYYFGVANTSNVIFGGAGSAKTLYAANVSGSYSAVHLSCQTTGKTESDAAWQSVQALAPDIIISQGDEHYGGGSFAPGNDVSKHINKYTTQFARLPSMVQALNNSSLEAQISDHEVCGNGQYESSPGVYGPWADQLSIFATAIDCFRRVRPVVYADTNPSPRGRYYYKDLFKNKPGGAASVRLFMLDERTLDTSDGQDADGPSKRKMGATQMAWLSANLLSTGLNLLCFESTGAWTGPNGNIDKWSNYWYEFATTLAGVVSGKPCAWVGGDRHMLAWLDHTQNTVMPGMDVMIGSAMEMFGLGVSAQEVYKDSGGVTRTFGYADDGILKRQYGRLTIADNNAGTITLTWTGWDAITGAAVLGPFSRTYTY